MILGGKTGLRVKGDSFLSPSKLKSSCKKHVPCTQKKANFFRCVYFTRANGNLRELLSQPFDLLPSWWLMDRVGFEEVFLVWYSKRFFNHCFMVNSYESFCAWIFLLCLLLTGPEGALGWFWETLPAEDLLLALFSEAFRQSLIYSLIRCRLLFITFFKG